MHQEILKGQLNLLTVGVVSFQADISWSVNDMPQGTIKQPLGYIPIMVKSKLCNLCGFSPQDLLQHHEEEEVTGILRVRKVCVLPEQSVRSPSLCRA